MPEPVVVAVITGAAIVLASVINAVSNRRTREQVTKLQVQFNGHMEELLNRRGEEGYAAGERHERDRDHSEDSS